MGWIGTTRRAPTTRRCSTTRQAIRRADLQPVNAEGGAPMFAPESAIRAAEIELQERHGRGQKIRAPDRSRRQRQVGTAATQVSTRRGWLEG